MTASDDGSTGRGRVPARRVGDMPESARQPGWLSWGVGLAAFIVAYLGTQLTWPLLQSSVFLLFFGAVAFTAWFGGRGPAVLVILLTLLAVGLRFYSPLALSDPLVWVHMGGFALIALLITELSDELRQGRRSIEVALATVGTLNAQLRERAESSEAQATRLAELAAALQDQAAELEVQMERVQELNALLEVTTESETMARAHAESASRAKSEFLAVMSHELRTPLNAIIGYGELLAAEVVGGLSDRQKEQVGRIHAAAWQLLELIEQILNLSRIEAGHEDVDLEEVDLIALTSDSMDLMRPLAEQRGLELIGRVPERPLRVRTDRGKVRQIALNLIANACKFTERGSVVVSLEEDDASAVLRVTDTGVGIPADQLERIFDPFVQADATPGRRRGGTGLGLAVSRRLARLLGGDVSVVSEPGKGSVFTVRIPRHPAG